MKTMKERLTIRRRFRGGEIVIEKNGDDVINVRLESPDLFFSWKHAATEAEEMAEVIDEPAKPDGEPATLDFLGEVVSQAKHYPAQGTERPASWRVNVALANGHGAREVCLVSTRKPNIGRRLLALKRGDEVEIKGYLKTYGQDNTRKLIAPVYVARTAS